MLNIVDVDFSLSIGSVEDFGLVGQASPECRQVIECGSFETVAATSVRTASAAAAVSSLTTVLSTPLCRPITPAGCTWAISRVVIGARDAHHVDHRSTSAIARGIVG